MISIKRGFQAFFGGSSLSEIAGIIQSLPVYRLGRRGTKILWRGESEPAPCSEETHAVSEEKSERSKTLDVHNRLGRF